MSESKEVRLNFSCISKVPLENYEKDFSFIVNGKEIKTSRIISDLISPKICEIHQNDPTFDTFIINTEHSGDFSKILNLIKFNKITLQKAEEEFFFEVIDQLGYDFLNSSDLNESFEITKENVFSLIKKHQKFPTIYNKNINEEIEFISTHFYELCDNNIAEYKNIEENIFREILKHPKLKLKDEDQLINFANEMYEEDIKYLFIYEYVIFNNVSTKFMSKFVDIFNYDYINNNIWQAISKRLQAEINNEKNKMKEINRYKEPFEFSTFNYESGKEFEGIIHYLTNKYGGNIADKNIIQVTSNDSFSRNPPKNMLDFNQDNIFISNHSYKSDIWICYDFKNYKINFSNYTIKTSSSGGYMKSWVFEVSKDNKEWKKIDERNNSGLNGPNITNTFNIDKNDDFYRYCRIRLTDDYYVFSSCLRINSIEFHGKLKEHL